MHVTITSERDDDKYIRIIKIEDVYATESFIEITTTNGRVISYKDSSIQKGTKVVVKVVVDNTTLLTMTFIGEEECYLL